MNRSKQHEDHMALAIELARRGTGSTRPNPLVGAVVVRDGEVVGSGFHERAGGPHAEVVALQQAGPRARGATLYVTLEPCNHHGRTPPCTEAILSTGIERVFYGSRDPNPKVEGGGAELLESRGVECIKGPLVDEAEELNRGFFHWIRTGRPWVISKFATSLDGKVATRTGESQWITCPESRRRTHQLRREVDAILVGAGTVIADDPLLTVRSLPDEAHRAKSGVESTKGIVRIIVDGRGRSPLSSKVFVPAEEASTFVATTESSSEAWRDELREAGVSVIVLAGDNQGRVDLVHLLEELSRREIRSILVEGGPTIHGSFFDDRLVNEVYAFIAPTVIGGNDAPGAVAGMGIERLSEGLDLHSITVEQIGEDVLIHGIVNLTTPGVRPYQVSDSPASVEVGHAVSDHRSSFIDHR